MERRIDLYNNLCYFSLKPFGIIKFQLYIEKGGFYGGKTDEKGNL